MDYRYIRAWGRMLGSAQYYITGQVEEARADGAPPDAIYKGEGGQWHTYADITNSETAQRIDILLEEIPE